MDKLRKKKKKLKKKLKQRNYMYMSYNPHSVGTTRGAHWEEVSSRRH